MLYRDRSSLPRYGFFVLNRQGLEYVQEFLTPESDVKVNGEFILYEPHGEAGKHPLECRLSVWKLTAVLFCRPRYGNLDRRGEGSRGALPSDGGVNTLATRCTALQAC